MTCILAIDPGPTTSGWVVYDTSHREVRAAVSAATLADVLARIDAMATHGDGHVVAIERVQSYGISGASLLETSEVVGRLWQRAEDRGQRVLLIRRQEVLRVLDVTGRGPRDAVVRQRLMELHGGAAAVGRKKSPGQLYGVSGHAWSALAIAVAAARSTNP